MSTKHTPGPWSAHFDHPQNACAHVRLSDRYRDIATVYSAPEDGIEGTDENGVWPEQPARDANAHLIAAAPDLLEALQELLAEIEFRIDDPRIGLFDAARAAVAKATGSAS